MNVETTDLAGVVVATPVGRLDLTSYIPLRDGLLKLAADAPAALVVRLGPGLEVPSTTMLSVFTTIEMRISQWPDIPLVLLAETSEHREQLRTSGVARFVRTTDDIKEAIHAAERPPLRRFRNVPLPNSPAAPITARAVVRAACELWGLPRLSDDAVLVVSELVENAAPDESDRRRGLRRLHRPAPGERGRVQRPVQHDPDQRHGVLPRPGSVGVPAPERHPGPAGRGDGSRTVPAAGQDLRHGRRRRGALPRPARQLRRARPPVPAVRAGHQVLRAPERPLQLPRGPAPLGHLRPQRPGPGRAHLAGRFHFALVPEGVLFLGKAEMLLSHSRIFDPIDLKRRLFRKTATGPHQSANFVSHAMVHDRRVDLRGMDELREHAFSASPVAQIVVTAEDVVALVNRQAETTFGLSSKDVGRPLRDVDISYRPVELRGYVEQARLERKSLRIKDVEWLRGPGESMWFEVHVNPLVGADNTILGVSVVFHDVTAARRLLEDLEHANRQLESAYEELQSTNEELETTNEELQSTNEELETMNEELQSTNDELQTINDALRERTGELDRVNEFLESILTSLRAGVIVLDVQMRVLAWNRGAEELWGVRRDEAEGEHLLNLDIGLPVADLRPVVRSALSDGTFMEEVKLSAVNRRGREVVIRVVCSSLRANGGEPDGAILVMEQQER